MPPSRWGESGVRASVVKYNAYTANQKAQIGAEGEAVYRDLLAVMAQGPAAPAVQACIERWRRHIDYFWAPNDEQCLALATGYRDDPAFRKTYDAIHPELASFMVAAVKVYLATRRVK